ncbi:MAG: acetoacetate--CoA ligase [Eudoraea sp.]|nr:acetoacetate--CoA ligase [Eudoraea sp.]NNJ41272.1 acetoacetate--CoA ligase [Eudoraea sp.]
MYNKIWTPIKDKMPSSHMAKFFRHINSKYNLNFTKYEELHQWSIMYLGDFWETIVDYFNISFDTPYKQAITPAIPFYNTKWFEGASLSYAAHITRNFKDQQTAILFHNELGETTAISWNALLLRAEELKHQMLDRGVGKGDCVVGYLLNHPDTIAAFLATNALGAVWSCCSPDFGIQSVINRFEQLEPKLLLAHTFYTYNGKEYQQQEKINALNKGLPSLQDTIGFSGTLDAWDLDTTAKAELHPVSVPFEHPIWVLFSSGTTGNPKAITHSTGGMLLEQFKALCLHQDVHEGERFFWNTTTGWMMWNYALGALLCGGVLCIYDGAANYPDLGSQWRFAQQNKIHHFGNGAPFYAQCMKTPPPDLTTKSFPELKTLGSTGAPLSASAFEFLQKHLPQTQIISLSGGTDVCSAFIGGNPMLPVYAGYIQCRMLGAAIASWDSSGNAVEGMTGELVITEPMPSMPVYFWGDEANSRYHTSYFDRFSNVWAHGDWIKIVPDIGIEVLGRSDATLNRHGIRIGTAEIYSALESFPKLDDFLIVDMMVKQEGFLLLFVELKQPLDSKIIKEIKTHIRTLCSPRHVPDRIIQVPQIPYTISGKKMEIPVKKLLMGSPLNDVASPGAMKNPKALEHFLKVKDQLKLQD